MPLKGLVKFFTVAMILVSVFQLSITYFVNKKDAEIAKRVKKAMQPFVNSGMSKDSLHKLELSKLAEEEAKAGRESTAYGMSYKKAKGAQLQLGLDLQGGMGVTLEIAMDGLIKTLTNNSRDAVLLKAVENTIKKKESTTADFSNIFVKEFEALNPTGKLAAFFAAGSNGALTVESSNNDVANYLRKKQGEAFESNFQIISERIDNFGLTQPNIYKDVDSKTITVELPGVKNPDAVRKALESSANLEMWEVAPVLEGSKALENANGAWSIDSASSLAGTKKKLLPDMLKKIKDGRGGWAIGYVKNEDKPFFTEMINSPAFQSGLGENFKVLYGKEDESMELNGEGVPVYLINTLGNAEPALGGSMITGATARNNPTTGQPEVSLELNQDGKLKFAELTGKLAGQGAIAIVLDNIVYSAPNVNEKIEGGSASISGGFADINEAIELQNVLKTGKLSAPLKTVQDNVVGPTLGEKAIKGGFMSFIISFLIIFALMLVYYNTAGWIANVALIANLLFTVGALSMLGFTLTAPGIAGLVLTIGMAVDTNVIIFERIKEELERGRTYAEAVKEGYKRSLAPVLDAHFTTFLTALILFAFGLGPIKGFATTQMLGIVLSLFCGILLSRLITEYFADKNKEIKYFTPLSKRIFKHAQFKFIEFRKITYIISLAVLALGIAAIFNGFDTGVEYSGGRSFKVILDKEVSNTEALRKALTAEFGGKTPIVKTINNSKTTFDITTSYLLENKSGDSIVKRGLYNGLKPYINADVTAEAFMDGRNKKGVVERKLISASISEELKSGARKAAIYSILIIALYIFIRFRDWRYSLGTIVALLHDVFVTLAVFSFFRHVMPFPLELDQHFIAAVLTVIGFSMNDTIIVFDRVRENAKKMQGESKEKIINVSINETLSRTIMTSLTVFLTILVLFIFGGDVTRGFAFAMLIGVIVGTYSSIFVAAPILVDFAKNTPLGKADFVDHTNEITAKAEKNIK